MKKLLFIVSIAVANAQIIAPSTAMAAQSLTQAEIKVDGMTCRGCEGNIKRTLSALAGVITVTASHKNKKVTVDFDASAVSLDAIKTAIKELGYTLI